MRKLVGFKGDPSGLGSNSAVKRSESFYMGLSRRDLLAASGTRRAGFPARARRGEGQDAEEAARPADRPHHRSARPAGAGSRDRHAEVPGARAGPEAGPDPHGRRSGDGLPEHRPRPREAPVGPVRFRDARERGPSGGLHRGQPRRVRLGQSRAHAPGFRLRQGLRPRSDAPRPGLPELRPRGLALRGPGQHRPHPGARLHRQARRGAVRVAYRGPCAGEGEADPSSCPTSRS